METQTANSIRCSTERPSEPSFNSSVTFLICPWFSHSRCSDWTPEPVNQDLRIRYCCQNRHNFLLELFDQDSGVWMVNIDRPIQCWVPTLIVCSGKCRRTVVAVLAILISFFAIWCWVDIFSSIAVSCYWGTASIDSYTSSVRELLTRPVRKILRLFRQID